jgi:hypothetical protein
MCDIFSYKAGTDSSLDGKTSLALREKTVQRAKVTRAALVMKPASVAQTVKVSWAAEAVTVMRWMKDVRITMTATIAASVGLAAEACVHKRAGEQLNLLTSPRGLSGLL